MKVYLTENIEYDIVYADPPWPKKKGGLRKSRQNQTRDLDYQTITLEEIRELLSSVKTTEKHNFFVWTVDEFLHDTEKMMFDMGYKLSVSDTRFRFPDGRKYSDEPVIIDNVEMVLQPLLGCPVETITFNSPHVITEKNRYDEEIAELKKELAACYREKEEDQGTIKKLRSICISQQNIINGQDLDKMTKSAIIKKRNRRRFAR